MRMLACAGMVAAASALGPPASVLPRLAADDKLDAAALYEKCVKSAVFIVTPLKDGSAMGSGSLIDVENRYVITNYHMVEDADSAWVQFPVREKDGTVMSEKKKYIERIKAGDALKGKVLHRDKTRDLALVQLDKLPPDTPALPLARTSVRAGEQVITIGNPGAVDWTFSTTQCTVRGVGVANWAVGGGGETLRIKAKMVTMTNPIGPTDSGGPVIDRRGYQIGVMESARGGAQNVNSAIDVTEVRAFLKDNKVAIKELADEKADPPPKK
jgi:S1-C subfamily serine protease